MASVLIILALEKAPSPMGLKQTGDPFHVDPRHFRKELSFSNNDLYSD